MSAAQFDREVMRELEEAEYAERLSTKWPCVALWPGRKEMTEAKKTGLELLREPFPANQISHLPKGG